MLKRICMALLAVVMCGAVQSASAANPRVVFMGDSITEGWGGKVPSFFTNNNFLCKGISGHTTGDMLARYTNDVINKKPQVVVILAGTNDIAQNDGVFVSMEQISNNIFYMAEMAMNKGIKVVLCSVLPSSGFGWTSIKPTDLIPRLNTIIEEWAAEHDCPYVDYYSLFVQENGSLDPKFSGDNCHPYLEGYYIMEQALMPILEPMLQ
ncbi:MAG: acylhydrolase [Rikenellaceae bacterium]|nr:acylhydrolase [Rikenellaceae bacterium]